MKWTKDDDDKLIELIKNGNCYSDISKIFNTTSDSIRGRCNKLNIKSSDFLKNKITIICVECGIDFLTKNKHRKFCCKKCSAKHNNKIVKKIKIYGKCKNCGTDIIGHKKSNNIYCSQKCQFEYQYKDTIKKWKDGEIDGNIGKNKEELSPIIRRYILEKYDYKCVECGWNKMNEYTGKIPLQIDHIDGDYLNSVEENLRALCPSCHSLTKTYGSQNKGNGRKNRRK